MPFSVFNDGECPSPVVLSVPHAGRDYPDLENLLQVPLQRLLACEDRFVDRLTHHAIAAGTTAIIAHTPRLWIDLNRSECDLDPAMVAGAAASAMPLSRKARGGLGLIPRRLAGVGECWRHPLTRVDVEQRIERHHRPYHARLSALLANAHARHGVALLIDLHSMPTLRGADKAAVVIGNRFGASAGRQITDSAEALLEGLGYRVAVNTPYAGGYILDRHGRPAEGIHALQVEFDRALYLDRNDVVDEAGADRLSIVVAALVARLDQELTALPAIAAE